MKFDLIDFPYYDGQPVAISGWQWLMVMAAIVCGFLVLTYGPPIFATRFGQFIPAILFSAITLSALAAITPRHWTALFRSVHLRDVMWMGSQERLRIGVGNSRSI